MRVVIWLVALILAGFSAFLVGAAAALSPRDPIDELLTEPKPWECGFCKGTYATQTGYLTHTCVMRVEP